MAGKEGAGLCVLIVLDRLGTWLGHRGRSFRCTAVGLALESQGDDGNPEPTEAGGRVSKEGSERREEITRATFVEA